MAFWVGQKVVCVDDCPNSSDGSPCPVKAGTVYIISGFSHGYRDGDGALHLVGVRGEMRPGNMGERGFHPGRFRPIVKRKTDISIFTKLLKPTRERADA